MKYYITYSLIFFCLLTSTLQTRAQQSNIKEPYKILVQRALETMWSAKDEVGNKTALSMYEEAFRIYPDSIDGTGLYKVSVLAATLKDLDKAFKYLTPLAAMKVDEDGYPGWTYIIGNYAEAEYKSLLGDPRWAVLKQKAIQDKAAFFQALKDKEEEFYQTKPINYNAIKSSTDLLKAIKSTNPYLPKKESNYSLSFQINDSTKTSFFVYLPANYNPQKKYALLIFLHGAVRSNALTDYQLADWNLGGWNRYYTKYAEANDVILVFPKGSRQYNWMTSDDGFFMVPEMLKLIKKAIHINDNKVFISGHSNGATGSFSYLMKQSTPFAGFYGFNTYPKVFTGGTFIENIQNRSFINFSTDQDYYYPPNANDELSRLLKNLKADYQEHRYNGFPHAFPKYDESEPAYKILFDDLTKRNRNPFPNKISWEFDNEQYGQLDWLTHVKLDTTLKRSYWHQELNFKINKWLEYDKENNLVSKVVDRNAFDFPRKSGKVKAQYQNNTFQIETSNIKSFNIYISPEMVDMKKNVKVYVNGKLQYNKKVEYSRGFILNNYKNNHDREQLWVNTIEITGIKN